MLQDTHGIIIILAGVITGKLFLFPGMQASSLNCKLLGPGLTALRTSFFKKLHLNRKLLRSSRHESQHGQEWFSCFRYRV